MKTPLIVLAVALSLCLILIAAVPSPGQPHIEYGQLAVSDIGGQRGLVWTTGSVRIDASDERELLKKMGSPSSGSPFVLVLNRIGSDGWRLVDWHESGASAQNDRTTIYLFQR